MELLPLLVKPEVSCAVSARATTTLREKASGPMVEGWGYSRCGLMRRDGKAWLMRSCVELLPVETAFDAYIVGSALAPTVSFLLPSRHSLAGNGLSEVVVRSAWWWWVVAMTCSWSDGAPPLLPPASSRCVAARSARSCEADEHERGVISTPGSSLEDPRYSQEYPNHVTFAPPRGGRLDGAGWLPRRVRTDGRVKLSGPRCEKGTKPCTFNWQAAGAL